MLTLCGLVCSSAAHAQSGVELSWTAPPECPGPEVVRREVEQAVPPGATMEPLRAAVAIRRSETGWHADVELTTAGRAEPRAFDAESCDELASAIGVVLSLVVTRRSEGPEVVPDEAEPEPSTAKAQPAEVPVPSTLPEPSDSSPAPGDERQPAPPPYGVVRLGVGPALGYLPDSGLGVELGAGIGVGPERVLLEFERWAGVHSEVERAGVAIVASRIGFGPTACYGGWQRMRVEVCAGVRAVLIDASGDDVAHAETDQGWFPSAVFRAGAGWALASRVRLGASAQLQAPLRRVEFRFDPGGSIASLPPLGGALTADLTWGK